MNIRPAQPGDLPALLEIFAHARAFMAQTGNPTQWPATYPGAELMQQQIARGVCYVLEGNARPEATFCYIPGPEPTYAEIYDGGWPDDAPYATIHRMASAGRVHGAAAICFAWCAARGLPLRADTHADNKVMQHLLEKNGFVRCGNITLADGTSRIAYHCTVPPRGGKQQTVAQAAAALAQAAKALPKPADGPLLVALDGRCAAGKTTIAKLALRLYDPEDGEIDINGANLAEYTNSSVRRAIAYVPQNIELFSKTIYDNIRISRMDATLDEVKEAAKKADAHEFIRHLPLQYNTYLEEAGNGLSGGEKQRIALARAFLKDSNLYILDESTSNLDFATETLIFNMIYEQLADRSMLIVAHRLSTIRDCDLILVMDHGKIVERGNHEELMAKNGRYAELWNMQQGIFRKRKSEPAPQVPSAVVEEDDDGESITY